MSENSNRRDLDRIREAERDREGSTDKDVWRTLDRIIDGE